jgi:DNA-binding response OmpR family regulator
MPKPHASPMPAHEVLILEDHDDIRDAIAFLFRASGFDVAPAWGVEDAYRQLRQGFRPCVVLLDLHMPGMDGWAFVDRMRLEPHLNDVPVIIMSGDGDQRGRTEHAGYEFLMKPTQPETLIGAIHRHCRRHQPG